MKRFKCYVFLLSISICSIIANCGGDNNTVNSCDTIHCNNHGVCSVVDGHAQCECEQGYKTYNNILCISENCETYCEYGQKECIDDNTRKFCTIDDQCPIEKQQDCPENYYCENGICISSTAVKCEVSNDSSTSVSAPQFVANYTIGNTGWFSSPAVVDINNDESMEIIAPFYDVVVWNEQGQELSRAISDTYHKGRVYAPEVVTDLEGDNIIDVTIAAGEGTVAVYEWTDDGLMIKNGWPQSTCMNGQCPENRSLAAADLDRDGNIEVVAASTLTEGEGHVFVWQYNGELLQPPGISWTAWPRYNTETGEGNDADKYCSGNQGYGCFGENIGIGNIDDDPELEIIATYDNHQIQAFNIDGTQLTADQSYFTNRESECENNLFTWGQFIRWIDYQVEDDHYHKHTGEWPHPSWTLWAQWTQSPPTVSDVDGDGNNEVVGVPNAEKDEPYHTYHHAVFVLQGDYESQGHRSARRMPGWENLPLTREPMPNDDWYPPSTIPAPVVVTIDGDNRPEIIFPTSDGYMYAYSPDAALLWEFDFTHGASIMGASEPVVVDLNGDGNPEIIFATFGQSIGDGYLIILSSTGSLLFDIQLTGQQENGNGVGVLAAPTVADIDKDGDLEILLLTIDHGLDIYSVSSSRDNCMLWPTGRANYLRNGMGPNTVQ